MNDSRVRSVRFEDAENIASNPSANPTMGDIVAERFSRRDLMKGVLAVSAISATVSPLALAAADGAHAQGANTTPSFDFKELASGADDKAYVADGYDMQVLIRWGDKVFPDAPEWDPAKPTAAGQAKQFGYNNDFLGYFPMPGAANGSEHGLLVVNHEYTNEELMFPGLGRQDARRGEKNPFAKMTKDIAEVEMMAHGGSVLEVRKQDGKWTVVSPSKYARRITGETEMRISGPAAGHARLKTSADPTGTKVKGMLNNCAGGVTPWGTWLTCEENVNGYFSGKLDEAHPEARNHKRMGVPSEWYNWGRYFDRFDVSKEPNEPNRFGWVVEIDPFDPQSVPVKRTALGRFKREGAAGIVNKDGRYVVYSGDDQRFDYVYKFVTEGRVDIANPAASKDLLDKGTASVARFNPDGTMEWLPLVHGQGPLTEANGFKSQADVAVEARRAADLLGATKMDRPEDVEANPKTNKVYIMLTNNSQRKADQVDAANPRANNRFGHIVEMTPPDGDHAAAKFKWDVLVRCGDPSLADVGAAFNPATSNDGWFGMPDNCAFDALGRLWISTDGNYPKRTGRTDGVWAMETEGPARGTSKLFFRGPHGAELCGPVFTPDLQTLFVAVQHPGETDENDPDAAPASFENPATRWPDFKDGLPPRPSIVVITRKGGGKIAV
ncbi:MAG: PhoX family protein [Hyphomicrobiaceae bacterium]